jgi:hypothetical protein
VAALEDLEARVAALEASQADYRAVLAAVNALGANQREHTLGFAAVTTNLAAVTTDLAVVRNDWATFAKHAPRSARSTSSSPKLRI